jgi:spermidine synthase
MESVAYTSALSENVHTVEIDGAVIAGSRKYMLDLSGLDKVSNWSVTIEDAKRFLGGSDKKYDLIVMDIPAPLTVQVGLLYSVDFYKLVRSRLTRKGVISVSLCGTLRKNNPTPDTIASAISTVFEDYYFYTPKMKGKSRTYVIAGKNIPFNKDDLKKVAEMNGAIETKVFSRRKARRMIGEFEPMRSGAMTFPVKRSIARVAKRLTSTKPR